MSEPTIKIQRASHPNERDYHVLINGEHRATFRSRKRWHRAGYDFQDAYGDSISLRRRFLEAPTKAEFSQAVLDAMHEKTIPTRAEIDRKFLIDQARKDNEEHDRQVSERRAQVRREVLCVALDDYLHAPFGTTSAEHKAMAERMLKEASR
jgi:hypothetical protein